MQRIEECLSMEAALPLFDLHGADAVEVFDTQGQVIGVLTRTDIEKAQQNVALDQLVGECMRYRITGITPREEAQSVDACGFDQEPLRSLLDALHDGVYITDANGVTVTINKAYERITGISRAEVVGFHMADLVKAGFISKSASLEVIHTHRPITLVQTIHDSRKIVVTGTPMFTADGSIAYVVTNVRDITELLLAKRAQEQLEQIQHMREAYKVPEVMALSSPGVITSQQTETCFKMARRVAKSSAKILIQGETGTGKTLLARYIHRESDRADGPFMELNCTAFPEGLLEAELFGYTAGAFTGAAPKGKQGLLDVAHGGTLFLDEIGDLPLALQVKLLKVVEENRYLPVGGTSFRQTNVRLITATHQDLHERVQKGTFREDLFYRISVVPLWLPPLRQRRDEVIPLLNYYLDYFNQLHGLQRRWNLEALELLSSYSWPGNIRELINLTERLAVTVAENEITVTSLPSELFPSSLFSVEPFSGDLRQQVMQFEQQLIRQALTHHGTTRAAAAALGVDQSTLVKKQRRWRSSAN
ncbi:sigma 54-interacting transcriptional regulator [Vreelandella janggokensis]|uniref:sigma 54-interacting transcriptional regulator n=1 Tax=Vreelandella janggokensis TaxID=370767 RepID=UPI00285D9BFC|nr:sigma 54-interacting transcriptional regulator [Halomonas janggokensis]MDR5886425.1 sigma 54-interacting transcriptional regulator [Halomonas janggokensis]